MRLTSKLTFTLVLLLCFTAVGYAQNIPLNTFSAPAQVINTGRSEVAGRITLQAAAGGTTVGGSIGILFPAPIDSIAGLAICATGGFVAAIASTTPTFSAGLLTIPINAGAAIGSGDTLIIDGVRLRIDQSPAATPGVTLFATLSSTPPTQFTFTPVNTVPVAVSFVGLVVSTTAQTIFLCPIPSTGAATIRLTEGFSGAFVDNDAGNDGPTPADRLACNGTLLGAPTNPTQIIVRLTGIPASVSAVGFPPGPVPSTTVGSPATLVLASSVFDPATGTATAVYNFETTNQLTSDTLIESFTLGLTFTLVPGVDAPGVVLGQASLGPGVTPTTARPRFVTQFVPDPGTAVANIIRCVTNLLFTFVTNAAGFNTGIAIANTSADGSNTPPGTPPFGTFGAIEQQGPVTLYFFDSAAGFVGSTTLPVVAAGRSATVLLNNVLPAGVTTFTGYIIAVAQFQFAHGFAFIADAKFGDIAHGYLANVIPDPAIAGGRSAVPLGLTGPQTGEQLAN